MKQVTKAVFIQDFEAGMISEVVVFEGKIYGRSVKREGEALSISLVFAVL